jgi:hypothetical protein
VVVRDDVALGVEMIPDPSSESLVICTTEGITVEMTLS